MEVRRLCGVGRGAGGRYCGLHPPQTSSSSSFSYSPTAESAQEALWGWLGRRDTHTYTHSLATDIKKVVVFYWRDYPHNCLACKLYFRRTERDAIGQNCACREHNHKLSYFSITVHYFPPLVVHLLVNTFLLLFSYPISLGEEMKTSKVILIASVLEGIAASYLLFTAVVVN